MRLPLPEIQICGGGAHAGRRIDIQDLMVMALAAKSFDEALEMTARVYEALAREGIAIPFPQQDIHIRSVSPGVEQPFTGAIPPQPGAPRSA